MEHIDQEKAQRVWQRVTGGAAAPEGSLVDLIAGEWADATTYLHLARQLGGSAGNILRRMFQQEQAHAACLKGIYALISGSRPSIPTPPPPREPTQVVLRRCYGREMQCLAQYESRTSDPDYGQVYAKLAAQEREHCKNILELLGKL